MIQIIFINNQIKSAKPSLQLYHSMLNNIRICPTCRSPLPTNTCKKCGYKQKILKVAEFQEDFGKINFANKIQTSNRENKSLRLLTSQEKLAIYLKQYQKLLIKAVEKIIEANQLNIKQRQQFRNEVKCIWQGYLLKIRNNSSQSLGMLKKQFNIEPNQKNKQNFKIEEEIKQIKESEQEYQEQQAQQRSAQSVQKKRRKSSKFKSVEKKQITVATKLRCYITKSVKPLMKESIQLRKDVADELTLAQKSFLSFLLGLKNIDQQFIGVARNKYLKLILEIDGNKLQKSFVKQSIISNQLQRRKLHCSKDRGKALNLILLYDILQCQFSANLYQQKIETIQQLLNRYSSIQANEIIDFLRAFVIKEKQKEEQNVPSISYQLIYSIMYLSLCRLGLTISIGEIMVSVGSLQIAKINIEEELFLPALLNQEAITSAKIRRTAHLLAKYLNLTFPVVINRWCRKWCSKFDIIAQLPKISALNRTIFKQVFKRGIRKRPNSDYIQKYLNYYRFYELQQDIASLSSLLVYVKLVDGLSDYPYLMNINVDLLKKEYSFDDDLLNSIEKLMKTKKINLQNAVTKQIVTKIIPEIYQQSFDLLKFTKKVTQINKNDKLLSAKMMNNDLINFRNLSHLNEVPSLKLLDIFKRFKSIKDEKQSEDEIKLRYNQIPHQQWTIQLAKSRKIKAERIVIQKQKPKAILCEDVIQQMNCIINEDQIIVNEQGTKNIECLLDEPSTNYELMYDYSSDNLTLVQRCQQLHLMQQLCLNVCSYNELTCWLNSYESILKRYQTK